MSSRLTEQKQQWIPENGDVNVIHKRAGHPPPLQNFKIEYLNQHPLIQLDNTILHEVILWPIRPRPLQVGEALLAG
jgi:hypothetical protein